MEYPQSLSLLEKIGQEEVCNWKGEIFVPFARLRSLLQSYVLKPIFQERGIEVYHQDEAIEAVLNGGHRVFAALNAIGQEASILHFKKNTDSFLGKPLDSGLPYDQNFLDCVLPDFCQQFYRIQWKFASPVLKKNLSDRVLHKRTVLPFIKVEEVSSPGAFAEVCRVTIPWSHQQIEPISSGNIVLVQKCLHLSNDVEQNFKHEQHILSMLRMLKHPCIVEFYGAFSHLGRPTLLFGEADCSLKEWLRDGRPISFSETETLEALSGLSSALSEMHQYFMEGQPSMIGCHFDLHPGNVLVRKRSFILSDFGLSRLKLETHGSKSYFKGGIRDYYAPECQRWGNDFDQNRIGRPSDIWSLGCIVAEVATVLRGGIEDLHRFDKIREIQGALLTLRTFHNQGRQHEAVTIWVKQLCTDRHKHEITVILAHLVAYMLVIDPTARADAQTISAHLRLESLNVRYRETVQLSKALIPISDYGWKVEYDRLTTFARQIGLGESLFNAKGIRWLLDPCSANQFERIRHLLLQIRDDCNAQLQYASNDILQQNNNLSVHVLRVSVDGLWQSQNPEAIAKMNIALENIILSVNDAEIPQVAKFLPNGSRPQLLLAIKQALGAASDNMNIKESHQIDSGIINGHDEWQNKLLGKSRTAGHEDMYILTEFVQYDDSWIDRSKQLVSRINILVSVLGKLETDNSLMILKCRSFCHLPRRQAYGIMYEIPKRFVLDNGMPKPLNLAEMIQKTGSRSKRPALGEVFNLAYSLASSLLSFHKAGWLHKSMSAYNVLFFPTNPEFPGNSLSTVRVIGFNHSRESDEGVFTVGPREDKYIRDYQHPEYRRSSGRIRFREEFDYYSLGLVLLELGRWKILREMTKAKDRQTLSPQDLKARLLVEEVTQLKSSMGVYYHDAVAVCFAAFHGKDVGSGRKNLWYEFDEEVVQRLSRCLAIHPENDEQAQ